MKTFSLVSCVRSLEKRSSLFSHVSLDESNVFIAKEDYCVDVYDINRFDEESFIRLKNHKSRITGVESCKTTPDGHLLYTISEDSFCYVYDLRKGVEPILTFNKDRKDSYVGLNCLSLGFNGNILSIGTDTVEDRENGDHANLLFYDIRSKNILSTLENVHSDIITSVEFNSKDNRKLLSSSADGLCCISDISMGNDSDSLETVFSIGNSVGSSGYFGHTNECIWSILSTQSITLHNCNTADVITQIDLENTLQPHKCTYVENNNTQNLYTILSDDIGNVQLMEVQIEGVKEISSKFKPHQETEPIKDIQHFNSKILTITELSRSISTLNQ